MSFGSKHYVPALRWRQGEFSALQELRPDQKSGLTPLIDIAPIPWDYAEEQPSKTIDQHLARTADQMATAWGTEDRLFVDFSLIDPAERMGSGVHPLEHLFGELRVAGVLGTPVTGLDRDPAYQAAVRSVLAADNRGVCIRITVEDAGAGNTASAVEHVLNELEAERGVVDLVIDLKAIEPNQATILRSWAVGLINGWPDIGGFASLTLLSGAFPLNLSGLIPGTHLVERADLALWQDVRAAGPARQPSFGDYTAAHPDPDEIDPRIMQVSASIRYASNEAWVILRGRSVQSTRHGGYGQFQALSTTLMGHPLFTGHSFSWASDFIEQCAAGGQTGNLMIWRKTATNRHMAFTSRQIASVP